MVADGAFSHKIEYVTIFQEILNSEGHQNCIAGLKVTAILLNGRILPVGGASSGRVCACSLHHRFVIPGIEPKKLLFLYSKTSETILIPVFLASFICHPFLPLALLSDLCEDPPSNSLTRHDT